MKQWHNQHLRHFFIGLIGLVFLSGVQLFAEEVEEFSLANLQSGKVVLSWEEMKKLLEEIERLKQDIEVLKKAQAQTEKKQKEPLPVEYSIIKSDFTGEVKGMSAQFKAEFSVQILKDGWVKIPFFSSDVGIEAISINPPTSERATGEMPFVQTNEPNGEEPHLAQFVREPEGYFLLASGPKFFTIQVTFRIPILVNERTSSLSFLPPRSVISHFTLRIPEKGINVIQKPSHSQLIQDKVTTIETVLSERESLQLSWKVEKDSSISRKSLAVIRSLASIDKSDISISSTIILKHVASLNDITFRMPLNVEIIDVTSLDIEQWATQKSEGVQIIKIVGLPNPRARVKIDMAYRLQLAQLPAEITIPTVEVIGTDTLKGFMGVEVFGNLEVSSKNVNNGILIPTKNLPKILLQKASNPLLYGYQFYRSTFKPSLNIRSYQEIQTVVANVDIVDCVTHRTLEGKSITRITYFIRNNDRQFLTLTLPKNSHLWQAFLNGKPVKPAQKDTGEILIPMKKSASQGGDLQSFSIEIGYITEVNKLTLKGAILNKLPAIDIPISYLRWSLYLPEYYEYSKFEGLLKQVNQFSNKAQQSTKPQIDIPTKGRLFRFEKHLIVDGIPYVRGKYGQFLGDDIFLSLHPFSRKPKVRENLRHPRRRSKRNDEASYKIPLMERDEASSSQQQVVPRR